MGLWTSGLGRWRPGRWSPSFVVSAGRWSETTKTHDQRLMTKDQMSGEWEAAVGLPKLKAGGIGRRGAFPQSAGRTRLLPVGATCVPRHAGLRTGALSEDERPRGVAAALRG